MFPKTSIIFSEPYFLEIENQLKIWWSYYHSSVVFMEHNVYEIRENIIYCNATIIGWNDKLEVI